MIAHDDVLYCEENIDSETEKTSLRAGDKPKITGRLYRRKMKRNKTKKRMAIASRSLTPYWTTETHIKYPKSSRRQKFWKRYANKAVRRDKAHLQNGSNYKRKFDYAWNVLD